jgi:acetyltransferase-like isoleucine patch superfamily enzyme
VNTQIREGILSVGKETYGYNNLIINNYKGSEAKVIIGNYCSLAPEIRIITGGIHPVNRITTYPFRIKWDQEGKYTDQMPYTKGKIVIGNDVWIATNVLILSGIVIGDGAVVASGSIVTKDVPPYAIVGGNPAKIIKFRFSEDKIQELLKIRWWDWDKEKIIKNIEMLTDENVDLFLRKHSQKISSSKRCLYSEPYGTCRTKICHLSKSIISFTVQ